MCYAEAVITEEGVNFGAEEGRDEGDTQVGRGGSGEEDVVWRGVRGLGGGRNSGRRGGRVEYVEEEVPVFNSNHLERDGFPCLHCSL